MNNQYRYVIVAIGCSIFGMVICGPLGLLFCGIGIGIAFCNFDNVLKGYLKNG